MGCKKTRIFVKEKKKRKNERENKKYRVKQFIEWQRMQCKQIEFIELRPQLSHQFIALKGNEREREGWRTLNENSLCFRFRWNDINNALSKFDKKIFSFFFFPSFFFSSRNSKPCTFRITILKWCSRVWNSIYWNILVNLVRCLGKASTAVKKISE